MAAEDRVQIPITSGKDAALLDLVTLGVLGHAVEGAMFLNDGRTRLWIHNLNAAEQDVTFVTQMTVDGLAVADKVIAIPAGKKAFVGPFRRDLYNRKSPDPAFPSAQQANTVERVYINAEISAADLRFVAVRADG